MLGGLNALMLGRKVPPSYGFLRGYRTLRLFKDVQRMFPAGKLEQIRRHGAELGMTGRHIDEGLRIISAIILHTGHDLDQITGEDLFQLRALGRRRINKAIWVAEPLAEACGRLVKADRPKTPASKRWVQLPPFLADLYEPPLAWAEVWWAILGLNQ